MGACKQVHNIFTDISAAMGKKLVKPDIPAQSDPQPWVENEKRAKENQEAAKAKEENKRKLKETEDAKKFEEERLRRQRRKQRPKKTPRRRLTRKSLRLK